MKSPRQENPKLSQSKWVCSDLAVLKVFTKSPEETLNLGERVGSVSKLGDVICLEGDLGTGKTVFVNGIARGLGFAGPIRSPTFIIISLIPEIKLCHVDAYRLDAAEALISAGIDEFLEGDWICVIEWAEKVIEALPADRLWVKFSFSDADSERIIRFAPGAGWVERIRTLSG